MSPLRAAVCARACVVACVSKLAVVLAFACGASACGRAPSRWPTPPGYRGETIPFPLEFAPGIAHRGVEEIRFAPGFFDPRSPGYFTYAFVWRIDEVPEWSVLAGELADYFRGLMVAVATDKGHTLDTTSYGATLVGEPSASDRARGVATASDAFGDGRPLRLVVRARRERCARGALFVFALSPREDAVADGAPLDALAGAATCAAWPR